MQCNAINKHEINLWKGVIYAPNKYFKPYNYFLEVLDESSLMVCNP